MAYFGLSRPAEATSIHASVAYEGSAIRALTAYGCFVLRFLLSKQVQDFPEARNFIFFIGLFFEPGKLAEGF